MMTTVERRNPDRFQMALASSTTWPEQTPTQGIVADASVPETASEAELERATMRKVMRRILPIIFVSWVVAYIDRANIGFAALTMNRDLGLSATAFGLGAGIFFLTYVAFEVPSNLALER